MLPTYQIAFPENQNIKSDSRKGKNVKNDPLLCCYVLYCEGWSGFVLSLKIDRRPVLPFLHPLSLPGFFSHLG